jgi:L-aminopeptidase/D-esterase-like protein
MTPHSLRQFAVQVHSVLAGLIRPYGTAYDGDVLYAVTTQEIADSELDDLGIGLFAADVAHQAFMAGFTGEA